MEFEIRTWNTDLAAEAINMLLLGRNISIEESILSGVERVIIEKSEIRDCDPTPESDGGLRDSIALRFEMRGGGSVTRYFEPINTVCMVHLETDDLMIIYFKPLHEYAKRTKEELDDRIQQNEEFYSK